MDIIIMSAHKFTLQLDIHGPASTDALQLMCFNHFDRRNRPFGSDSFTLEERPQSTGVPKVFPDSLKKRIPIPHEIFRKGSISPELTHLFGSTLVVKIKKTQESTPSI